MSSDHSPQPITPAPIKRDLSTLSDLPSLAMPGYDSRATTPTESSVAGVPTRTSPRSIHLPMPPDAGFIGIFGLPSRTDDEELGQAIEKELEAQGIRFSDELAAWRHQYADYVYPGRTVAFKDPSDTAGKIRHSPAHERIVEIRRECANTGQTGVVSLGEYTAWDSSEETYRKLQSDETLQLFTHVVHVHLSPSRSLDAPRTSAGPPTASRKTEEDVNKDRQLLHEIELLYRLCYMYNIVYHQVRDTSDCESKALAQRVVRLLGSIAKHTEDANTRKVLDEIEQFLEESSCSAAVDTVWVMDSEAIAESRPSEVPVLWADDNTNSKTKKAACDLQRKMSFSTDPHHAYIAGRQLALMASSHGGSYGGDGGKEVDELILDSRYGWAACELDIKPEFLDLIVEHGGGGPTDPSQKVAIVIVSSAPAPIWQKLLGHYLPASSSPLVKVIGGGVGPEGLVVTPAVKAALLRHMRELRPQLRIHAFAQVPRDGVSSSGQCCPDLLMLREANRGYLVVGRNSTLLKGEKDQLTDLLDEAAKYAGRQGRTAYTCSQILTEGRGFLLEVDRVPVFDVVGRRRKAELWGKEKTPWLLHAHYREGRKLLASPLAHDWPRAFYQKRFYAHSDIGRYLAVEFLAEEIGVLDNVPQRRDGALDVPNPKYWLRDEERTLIACSSNGGHVGAGIRSVVPSALSLNMGDSTDLSQLNYENISNLIIVDDVVDRDSMLLNRQRVLVEGASSIAANPYASAGGLTQLGRLVEAVFAKAPHVRVFLVCITFDHLGCEKLESLLSGHGDGNHKLVALSLGRRSRGWVHGNKPVG